MKIFLTILFFITTLNFLGKSIDEEEGLYKIEYIMATCFMSALLFLIYYL
ncbi:MAG TPA: hypothetical protein GXX63_02225 [Tissierellia bacterium]|nr:hypothetical protein [Tissierellia bacterium]